MKCVSMSNLVRAVLFALTAIAAMAARAQHPSLVVPGSERMLLGTFALQNPDAIDESGIPRDEFNQLYEKLQSQVVPPKQPDTSDSTRPVFPSEAQIQTLNWLLLDSLTPAQGQRLVQLLNRHAVAVARWGRDRQFMFMPIPLYAPEVQRKLGIDKDGTRLLNREYEAAHDQLEILLDKYRSAMVDHVETFTQRIEKMMGDDQDVLVDRVLGKPMAEQLRAATWDDSAMDSFLQQLIERRPLLLSELWLDDAAITADNSLSQKMLLDALLMEPEATKKELNLSRAQFELLEMAVGYMHGRIPLDEQEFPLRNPPVNSFLEHLLVVMETNLEKARLSAQKARQAREKFMATLHAQQKQRYRELMNQVTLQNLPTAWLVLDASVRDLVRLDFERSRDIDQETNALVRRIETERQRLRAEFKLFFQQVENDGLTALTPDQQAKYREWFGPPLVFENWTIRLLEQLKTDVSSKPK